MPPEIFHDAKLKIKRANQHIQELQRQLDVFLKTDFCRFHVKEDTQTGRHFLKFEQTKLLPVDIPAILGDALHNLRSVLDYVAFEIVNNADGSTDYVKFPVRETRDELITALKGGEIQAAGADLIALIRDVIQPYKGGNGDAVWVLHGLDITDKHFRCVPVISVAALTHVTGTAGVMTFADCSFAVGEGGELNIVGMPGKFTFQGYGQPAFAVLFGKGQVFEGQPVIPMLHQLAQLIASIVQAIEQTYLARPPRAAHAPPAGSHPPEA